MKLVKVDKAYSEMQRKSKPVPVRPGLALGVITLQVLTTKTTSCFKPSTYVGSSYGTMIALNIIDKLELHEGLVGLSY